METREQVFTDFLDKVEYEGDFLYVLQNWPNYIDRIEFFEPELATNMRQLLVSYDAVWETVEKIGDEINYEN
jgi:hypothetical protein